jgi:hypothetical protein
MEVEGRGLSKEGLPNVVHVDDIFLPVYIYKPFQLNQEI